MRRTFALICALGVAVPAVEGHAQAADEPPMDEIEIVETRSEAEIVLVDADFLRPEDVSTTIFGGTAQFVDGEMILIELELNEPITSEELDALKAESGNEARFTCEEAVLYLANGWHVAMATGCAVRQDTGG